MPLQATSGGRSLGFLKTVPKVLTGLKAVVMLVCLGFSLFAPIPALRTGWWQNLSAVPVSRLVYGVRVALYKKTQ